MENLAWDDVCENMTVSPFAEGCLRLIILIPFTSAIRKAMLAYERTCVFFNLTDSFIVEVLVRDKVHGENTIVGPFCRIEQLLECWVFCTPKPRLTLSIWRRIVSKSSHWRSELSRLIVSDAADDSQSDNVRGS